MILSVPERTAKLKWWFIFFLLVTTAYIFWMRNYLHPLQSGDIVKFEMAKTTGIATAIIETWKGSGKLDPAIQSIYLDYIFIIFYSITIALGCQFMSGSCGNDILARTGKLFAILIFLAAVFDVVENQAMMQSLQTGVTPNLVSVTHKMAISKFSIIFMALIFIAVCFVSWISNNLGKKEG